MPVAIVEYFFCDDKSHRCFKVDGMTVLKEQESFLALFASLSLLFVIIQAEMNFKEWKLSNKIQENFVVEFLQ